MLPLLKLKFGGSGTAAPSTVLWPCRTSTRLGSCSTRPPWRSCRRGLPPSLATGGPPSPSSPGRLWPLRTTTATRWRTANRGGWRRSGLAQRPTGPVLMAPLLPKSSCSCALRRPPSPTRAATIGLPWSLPLSLTATPWRLQLGKWLKIIVFTPSPFGASAATSGTGSCARTCSKVAGARSVGFASPPCKNRPRLSRVREGCGGDRLPSWLRPDRCGTPSGPPGMSSPRLSGASATASVAFRLSLLFLLSRMPRSRPASGRCPWAAPPAPMPGGPRSCGFGPRSWSGAWRPCSASLKGVAAGPGRWPRPTSSSSLSLGAALTTRCSGARSPCCRSLIGFGRGFGSPSSRPGGRPGTRPYRTPPRARTVRRGTWLGIWLVPARPARRSPASPLTWPSAMTRCGTLCFAGCSLRLGGLPRFWSPSWGRTPSAGGCASGMPSAPLPAPWRAFLPAAPSRSPRCLS